MTGTRTAGDGDRVRCALRALAATDEGYRDDLRAATAALEDVREAADFVAGGGRSRLRRAARLADRAGDAESVREARRVRRTLDRVARAAAGLDPDGTAPGETAPPPVAADRDGDRGRNREGQRDR